MYILCIEVDSSIKRNIMLKEEKKSIKDRIFIFLLFLQAPPYVREENPS